MQGTERGRLELLLVGSLVNSKPIAVSEAIELVEHGTIFSDASCQKAMRAMSESVSKLSSGTTRLDRNWWVAVLTNNGKNNSELKELLDHAYQSVAETRYARDPLSCAKDYLEEYQREEMQQMLLHKARGITECDDITKYLDKTIDELAELRLTCLPGLDKEQTLRNVLQEIEAIRSGQVSHGVPLGISGSSRLANAIRLRPGRIYTLGALKKTGKSKFLVFVLARAADQGIPTAYLSLEMGREQVFRWFLGLRARVDTKRIPGNDLTDEEMKRLHEAARTLGDQPFDVMFSPGATVGHVRHVCRKMRFAYPKAEHLILGIDYFQAMQMEGNKNDGQAQVMERAMYGILRAAQEYQVSIVLLSQLPNRAEGMKRHTIGDLKGSGAIAEASEAVMLLDNGLRNRAVPLDPENPYVPFSLSIDQRDGESGLEFNLVGDLRYGEFFEDLDTALGFEHPY